MSSDNVKGVAELEFKKDRFSQSINSAKREINELGTQGKDALSGIANKSKDASAGLDKVSSSSDKANQSLKNVNQTSKQTQIDMKVTGLTIAGTAASAFSLVQGFTGVQTKMIDIRKINLDVEKSQANVNKMIKEGKQGTQEYSFALEDLKIKQQEQKIKNDELNNTYVQMGFSLVTMASTTIPLVISALGSLKSARLGSAAATGVAAGANVGFTASLVSTTAAVWANTVALLSNPIFAAAAAASIAAAVLLISTNTWGLRDSLFGATKAVEENTTAINKGEQSFYAYGESIEKTTEKVTAFGDGLNRLSSSFDILSFSLKGAGKPMDTVFQGWQKAMRESREEAEKLNKETDLLLKKNNEFSDNFSGLLERYKESQGIAIIRELIDLGVERYKNGDLGGAIAVERAIQMVGRNTPSFSGKLRSITDQIKKNTSGWSTISNIGGGVGSLVGSMLSASGITGRQSQEGGILGMLNLVGLKSFTVSHYTKAVSGMSAAGYISAKLSGVSSPVSVSKGGSQASGRSSKHGASNRAGENQRAAAAQKLDAMLQGVTGYSLQELTNITGLQLFSNLHFGESGRTALSGNFGSYAAYSAAQDNIARQQDAIQKQVAANVAEVQARSSLLSHLSAFAGDPEIMKLAGTNGLRLSSSQLNQILDAKRSKASSYASTLGLTESSVTSLFGSSSGFFDLNNMLAFHERMVMEQNSIG